VRESIQIQIINKAKRFPRGKIFFVDSFAGIGNAKAVNKALERLVKSGVLERAATGVYVRPVTNGHLGKVLPSPEDIAAAIAKRDRATIVPTGSYALYKLGLTTQVPLNLVYYTDASARKIKVGKQVITFKKASAKYLSFIGGVSQLAIQALREIGKDQVTAEEVEHLKGVLKNEDPRHLQHDLQVAPVWIRKLLAANG
jgi:predicted transcriptional regulator of viral defense system